MTMLKWHKPTPGSTWVCVYSSIWANYVSLYQEPVFSLGIKTRRQDPNESPPGTSLSELTLPSSGIFPEAEMLIKTNDDLHWRLLHSDNSVCCFVSRCMWLFLKGIKQYTLNILPQKGDAWKKIYKTYKIPQSFLFAAVEKVTSPPSNAENTNVWIVIGVVIPLLVVFIILSILYWKLCRTDKLEFQPDAMTSIQQRQKVESQWRHQCILSPHFEHSFHRLNWWHFFILTILGTTISVAPYILPVFSSLAQQRFTVAGVF